jgi:hypothetical protein
MTALKAGRTAGEVAIIGLVDWPSMKVTGNVCVPVDELKRIEPL